MRAVIVGGRLQGVEAVTLAEASGWESVVVDRDENAPASGLCTRFAQGDARDPAFMAKICKGADLILPAIEKQPILNALDDLATIHGLPLVHDKEAYAISSSKLRSDQLFAELDLPAPIPWPSCGLPVLCKPSEGSGSRGVTALATEEAVADAIAQAGSHPLVLQQYVSGPSYSIEVVGDGKHYFALQTTQLFMDRDYDCKRVLAPSGLAPELESAFRRSAIAIAKHLGIRGIFDVEAILHEGKFYILEIDARLPSQTPTAVLHSCGINMLELLWQAAHGQLKPLRYPQEQAACLYEQIHVKDGVVRPCGEHIMGTLGPLRRIYGFFGADFALVSDRAGTEWAAILIYRGDTRRETLQRHRDTVREIRRGERASAVDRAGKP